MGHGVEGRTTPPAHLDADSAASVAATLQALATPSRLRMLTRLRHSACSVSDLADGVDMEQSAVS
ncbi:MAG TPA: ArsR family transcriptional regulator, partial [Mycobacterium sp.]|nr:ArsR family transcriptional regulator [Mycobacterium sp.]